MKPGTKIIIAGVGLASLLYGNAVGLFGGVEGGGGSSKKGTVTTGVAGITPEIIPEVYQTPYTPQPSYTPAYAPQVSPLEQLASALQLTDLQMYPQSSGEMKYSGIRETETKKKYIEGTLRTDLFGQMSINPETLQLYTTNTGGVGSEILYTEASRNIPSTTTTTPPTKKEIVINQTPRGSSGWSSERRAGYTVTRKK